MEQSRDAAAAGRGKRGSFKSDLWQLTQGATVLLLAAGFAIDVGRMAYALLTQGVQGAAGAVSTHSFVGVSFPLPDPLAELVIACILLGVLTYIGLAYVCDSEWVQETVQYEDCWHEKDWWNPFHWVWVLVCVVKETVKWVLKTICGWKEIFAIVLTVVCIVIVVVVVLAG